MATRPALTVATRKDRRKARRRRRHWWFLLTLGIAAEVFGGVLLLAQAVNGRGSADAGTLPVERITRAPPAALGAPFSTATAAGRAFTPPPARLRLSRLDIDAPVTPVPVGADGLLVVPDNPRQLGWWSASGRPGMPHANVVIVGHVDSATRGLGALFLLHAARPGDEVMLVNEAGASSRYTVVARRSYAKASLPAAEIFARDVGPRLVLITCGGNFDQATRRYADNVVIYAVPK
ncbi:MAG: hypothetical protein QOE58_2608 [Actinomycetota bacterium]|jgi:hypothetical protein|nr:hypothetical protein [Actinomycetota bacterium]